MSSTVWENVRGRIMADLLGPRKSKERMRQWSARGARLEVGRMGTPNQLIKSLDA